MAAASHRLRMGLGLALGLALAVALAGALQRGTARETAGTAARERAVAAGRALAAAVEEAWGGDVAGAIAAWERTQPPGATARAVALSGARLEASTFEADRGERAAPRRLQREEKPIYDRAQRLRGEVEAGAGKDRPVEVWQAGARLGVAAPVAKGGAVVGAVEAELAPAALAAAPSPLVPALAFALPLLGFALAALALGERRLPLAAAALVALAAGVAGLGAASARALGGGAPGAAGALAVVGILSAALALFVGLGAAGRAGSALRRNRQAYVYVAPAMLGMLLLVFFPFAYGIALSFTDSNIYNTNVPLAEIWIGLRNYADILADLAIARRTPDGDLAFNYYNFYWTLLFTVFWTVTNVTIGVTVGLALALALDTKGLAGRPIYRVLLILPWAVPNYITALVWRGMFHQQFGVVNQVVQLLGGDPVAWFDRPATSFLTALATNGWLSFPFMMVVSLGALQSIPADVYEAARVDGASRWQQFTAITLPSLKPALVPAVILSVVWTFNMFNIIFLVTGGEPGGATEILVTQSYKYAFERYRYGYAAAYSAIIFGILLVYGVIQNRVSRATEAA